jgi:hypothetical protein
VRNLCHALRFSPRTDAAQSGQRLAHPAAKAPLSFPTSLLPTPGLARGPLTRRGTPTPGCGTPHRDSSAALLQQGSARRPAPSASLSAGFRPQRPGCPFGPAGPCSLSSDRRHELHLSLDGPRTAGGRSVVSCHRPQARTVACRRSAQSGASRRSGPRVFGCQCPHRAARRGLAGSGRVDHGSASVGHPLRVAARSASLALSPPTNGWEEGVSCRVVPSAGIEGRWTVPPTFEGVLRSLAHADSVIPDRRHAFQASLSCRQTGEEGVSCRVVRPPALHARWCRRSGVTERPVVVESSVVPPPLSRVSRARLSGVLSLGSWSFRLQRSGPATNRFPIRVPPRPGTPAHRSPAPLPASRPRTPPGGST